MKVHLILALFGLAITFQNLETTEKIVDTNLKAVSQAKGNSQHSAITISSVKVTQEFKDKEFKMATTIPSTADKKEKESNSPYFLIFLFSVLVGGYLLFRNMGLRGDINIENAKTVSTLPEILNHGINTHPKIIEKEKDPDQVTIIKNFMVENQPYLKPDLTLQELANLLNMDSKDLSFVINNSIQQNFYDFINTYRIDKAKELLQNSKYKDLTIQEILYKVGFNSKSSFNTSFKKQLKFTPTEFRRSFMK